jgi:hypothetical protein
VEDIREDAKNLLSIIDIPPGTSATMDIPHFLQSKYDAFRTYVFKYNTNARQLSPLLSELLSYFSELEEHPGMRSPHLNMNLRVKVSMWWNKCEELLSAEAIAKTLPDVNRKIMFSIQKFIVGLASFRSH